MASREKQRRIDDQWQALQPGWGRKDYKGERKMLYDLLEPGEDVELLHTCGFETKNVTWGSRHDRGVVVATGRRVILLNRGRLSKNRFGLTYLEIDEITEPGPGRIRLRESGSGDATDSESGAVFDLDLQFAAADFSRFVRGRLLSDEESVAAAFSHVLARGEQVRHWARCSAGPETVFHNPGSGGGPSGSHTPESWETSWDGWPALAVDTGPRILLITLAVDTDLLLHAREEEVIEIHGSILWVEYWGGTRVRFVDVDARVHALEFRKEADATQFVDLISQHFGTAARRVSAEVRISAEWKLQHPLWDRRKNHGGERRKLAEIMDDDEHIEALAWGDYRPAGAKEELYGGIIAATGRRLLLVSNGLLQKNVSQLPYEGIDGVALKSGDLIITAKSGHSGYEIFSIDDMDPHHSRNKGYGEVFASRLQVLVGIAHRQASAP